MCVCVCGMKIMMIVDIYFVGKWYKNFIMKCEHGCVRANCVIPLGLTPQIRFYLMMKF